MEAHLTTAPCNLCKLLQFDDLAAGCREVVDEKGQARLSFEGAKVELHKYTDRVHAGVSHKLIRLRWHLSDSLPHLPRLTASGRAGCSFCTDLRLRLKYDYDSGFFSRNSIFDGDVSLTAYISLWGIGIDGIMIELISNEIEGEEKSARLFFPAEASPGCQRWLGAEPFCEGDYGTSKNISEICQVLGECTASCHPWKASFMPTRLIDVGASPTDTPRLVLSSEILVTEETKYAALSYCWGDKHQAEAQLKTETTTLEERLQGIPCETMSATIREAVALTKAIGLRYVWIDALCIIQDDAADWSYESGQMHRVYHHAFVTFCALVSLSCQDSFLRRFRPIRIPFQSAIRPSIKGHLLVRFGYSFYGNSADATPIELDRTLAKWVKRAWTYQEEKLSTRLILFGASKMHFQCGMHEWSEGGDKLLPLEYTIISLYDRIAGIERGEYPASSLYDDFTIFVDEYAHRDITYEKDRLPAFSGLARLVWEALGDQYLAGLWKGNIFKGLTWAGEPVTWGLQNRLQSIREGEYIAPSWSWAASYDGWRWFDYNSGPIVPECTLLDADVKTDPQNPFGRVYGGYLRIRGKVAPIPSSLRKGSQSNDDSGRWCLKFDGEDREVTAHLDWRPRHEEEGLENLVMLLLCLSNPLEQAHDPNPSRLYVALILYPTENPDEYYRVGLVDCYGTAASDLMRSWFKDETNGKVCTII